MSRFILFEVAVWACQQGRKLIEFHMIKWFLFKGERKYFFKSKLSAALTKTRRRKRRQSYSQENKFETCALQETWT